MEIQELLTQMRAPGIVFKTFTQSAAMFKGPVRRRRPAFDDWLHQFRVRTVFHAVDTSAESARVNP